LVTKTNEEQQCKFFNLLIKYQNVFSKNRSDLGKTDLVQHKIDTGDAVPFKMQPRRLPLAKREAVKTEIDRLICIVVLHLDRSLKTYTTLLNVQVVFHDLLRHEKHTCVMGTVYLVPYHLKCNPGDYH
jgi:hypothetical protein